MYSADGKILVEGMTVGVPGGHSNEDDDLAYAIELSALEAANSEEPHRRRRSRGAQTSQFA